MTAKRRRGLPDKVWIQPLPGILLAGIPAAGAEVDRALADEWLTARLVRRITPPASPAKEG